MSAPDRHDRAAGLFSIVLGVAAVAGYAVLGASPRSPGLPTLQLMASALLVIAGEGLRRGAGPGWGRFVVGLLAGLVVTDLLARLLA